MIYTGKTLDETDIRILCLKADGYTFKEIAVRIHLSLPSVVYRIQEMKKHFKCTDIAHLIAYAKDNGIL